MVALVGQLDQSLGCRKNRGVRDALYQFYRNYYRPGYVPFGLATNAKLQAKAIPGDRFPADDMRCEKLAGRIVDNRQDLGLIYRLAHALRPLARTHGTIGDAVLSIFFRRDA